MGMRPVAINPVVLEAVGLPGRAVPTMPAAEVVLVALRTLLLVAIAAAGILVLLPAALGAVATRVLGAG